MALSTPSIPPSPGPLPPLPEPIPAPPTPTQTPSTSSINIAASATIAESTDITGTIPYRLLGALAGCFRFRDSHKNGDIVEYFVTDGSNVEVATGELIYGSPDTLTRGHILVSSSGGKVNWLGGTRPIVREAVPVASATTIAIRKIIQGSTTTLLASDYMIEVISGSLAVTTINGPLPGILVTGSRFEIKDKTGLITTYPITFVPNGNDTVDGETSYRFSDNFGAWTLTWDGDEWSVT